jgi:hypothetical protein
MESYLRVTFSSEGSPPSLVADRLLALGFHPTQGNYDFLYDWRGEASLDEIGALADRITESLRGHRVLFEMETV